MYKLKSIIIFSLLFVYIYFDLIQENGYTHAVSNEMVDSSELEATQVTTSEEEAILDDEYLVPSYWMKRDELFETFETDSGSVIFIGNSLTQNFELAELFRRSDLKNRGIIGDMIPGVIDRLSPIINSQPSKIFIEIGINDLGRGYSEERVFSNYEILLDTLKSSCKNTKIYVQSILPTGKFSETYPTYCGREINTIIESVNSKLEKAAIKRGMYYIDLHRHFEKNGYLNDKYSVDGVHINGQGYLLWTKILKPYLKD